MAPTPSFANRLRFHSPTQATAAAAMPPKIEGPTQHQLTTDEEWATVHGDDAEKGWLRAGW